MENNYSSYLLDCTDLELTREWNRLETLKLTDEVEKKMDLIMRECQLRGIVSWNDKGEITGRIDKNS